MPNKKSAKRKGTRRACAPAAASADHHDDAAAVIEISCAASELSLRDEADWLDALERGGPSDAATADPTRDGGDADTCLLYTSPSPRDS